MPVKHIKVTCINFGAKRNFFLAHINNCFYAQSISEHDRFGSITQFFQALINNWFYGNNSSYFAQSISEHN